MHGMARTISFYLSLLFDLPWIERAHVCPHARATRTKNGRVRVVWLPGHVLVCTVHFPSERV